MGSRTSEAQCSSALTRTSTLGGGRGTPGSDEETRFFEEERAGSNGARSGSRRGMI